MEAFIALIAVLIVVAVGHICFQAGAYYAYTEAMTVLRKAKKEAEERDAAGK